MGNRTRDVEDILEILRRGAESRRMSQEVSAAVDPVVAKIDELERRLCYVENELKELQRLISKLV